jgi:hypothetical protein
MSGYERESLAAEAKLKAEKEKKKKPKFSKALATAVVALSHCTITDIQTSVFDSRLQVSCYTSLRRTHPRRRSRVKSRRLAPGDAMTMPCSYLPICSICNKPVKLESGKVDELGKAVHEGRYLLKVGLRRATTPSKAQRGNLNELRYNIQSEQNGTGNYYSVLES